MKGLHTDTWCFTGTWGGKEDWGKASILCLQFVCKYMGPKLVQFLHYFVHYFNSVFFLIFSSGSGVAQKVTQDQPDITSQVGQSVTLNCQYEVNWYRISYSIFWYKQLLSGQMTYLIRQYSENGNARDGRYSVNFQKADNSISLTIPALQLEDTAKYFCALTGSQCLK